MQWVKKQSCSEFCYLSNGPHTDTIFPILIDASIDSLYPVFRKCPKGDKNRFFQTLQIDPGNRSLACTSVRNLDFVARFWTKLWILKGEDKFCNFRELMRWNTSECPRIGSKVFQMSFATIIGTVFDIYRKLTFQLSNVITLFRIEQRSPNFSRRCTLTICFLGRSRASEKIYFCRP